MFPPSSFLTSVRRFCRCVRRQNLPHLAAESALFVCVIGLRHENDSCFVCVIDLRHGLFRTQYCEIVSIFQSYCFESRSKKPLLYHWKPLENASPRISPLVSSHANQLCPSTLMPMYGYRYICTLAVTILLVVFHVCGMWGVWWDSVKAAWGTSSKYMDNEY